MPHNGLQLSSVYTLFHYKWACLAHHTTQGHLLKMTGFVYIIIPPNHVKMFVINYAPPFL